MHSILHWKGHVTCLAFEVSQLKQMAGTNSWPVKADMYEHGISQASVFSLPPPQTSTRSGWCTFDLYTCLHKKKKRELSIPNVEISGVHVNTILSSPCSSSWSKARGRWAPAVSYEEQEEMGAEPWPGLFRLHYAGQEATFVIQRDHHSPATSTERSCCFCVEDSWGASWSPPTADKPTPVDSPARRHANAAPLDVSKLYTALKNTAMVTCLISKAAAAIQAAVRDRVTVWMMVHFDFSTNAEGESSLN